MQRLPRTPFRVPFGWFEVCPSAELQTGQVIPLYLWGRHLVLWRDQRGIAHLNDAFCPHQGAHLGYVGTVNGERLRCRFHGWEFEVTGDNCGTVDEVPTDSGAALTAYPACETAGIIHAWFHPGGAPPSWDLPDVEHEFSPTGPQRSNVKSTLLQSRVVFAPWQEIAENNADGLHLQSLHGYQAIVREVTRDRHLLRGRVTAEGHSLGVEDATFTFYGPGVLHLLAADTPQMRLEMLWTYTPVDTEKTIVTVRCAASSSVPGLDGSIILEQVAAEIVDQFEQDIPVLTHKVYRENAPLTPKERAPITTFRAWAAQFYADGLLSSDEWESRPLDRPEQQDDFQWQRASRFRESVRVRAL